MFHRSKIKTLKKTSSKLWLRRQARDQYVLRASAEGFRARSAYKLLEIDKKYHLLHANTVALDLGAAPGSWSQVLVQSKVAKVIAIDLLPMEHIGGVTFIQKDFCSEETQSLIIKELKGSSINLVLSDMSPNTIGHQSTDHLRIMGLCDSVLDFACKNLEVGGALVMKIFQGGETQKLVQQIRQHFTTVKYFKPDSSRKESVEIYLVAQGFKS
jgi:23S rRNA (uridine2552-2'-O)-methyltransferase